MNNNMHKFISAVSYISTLLGQESATSDNGHITGVHWSHQDHLSDLPPLEPDDAVPYLAGVELSPVNLTIWLHDDLRQDLYYQIVGYATLNDIEMWSAEAHLEKEYRLNA